MQILLSLLNYQTTNYLRSIFFVDFGLLHGRQCFESADDAAENSVFTVQMLARTKCDKTAHNRINANICTYNCDLFVLGPEFAIDSMPRPSWCNDLTNSSLSGPPNAESPPVPLPVGSPPWICAFIHSFNKDSKSNHKVLDKSMKDGVRVIAALTVTYKVVTRLRYLFTEQLHV
jgi:hypothetical protein